MSTALSPPTPSARHSPHVDRVQTLMANLAVMAGACRKPARMRRVQDSALPRLVADLVSRRRTMGLTQERLAGKLGTTKSAISRLERHTQGMPNFSTLENYALIVGCELRIELRARGGSIGGEFPW